MTVGRICQRKVDVVHPDDSVRVAARRMCESNVGMLVVLHPTDAALGILTDRDLAVKVIAVGLDVDATRVADVMTPNPRTVAPDLPIEDALAIMQAEAVRRLPVLDADRNLVGIVTLDDFLGLLADEFGELHRLLDKHSPQVFRRR